MTLKEQLKQLKKNNLITKQEYKNILFKKFIQNNKIISINLNILNSIVESALIHGKNHIYIKYKENISCLFTQIGINDKFGALFADQGIIILNKQFLKKLNKLLKYYSYEKWDITEKDKQIYTYITSI